MHLTCDEAQVRDTVLCSMATPGESVAGGLKVRENVFGPDKRYEEQF